MEPPKIASRDEWLIARKAHLAREKQLTRLRDQVSAERRELPWVKVEKDYIFDGPDGKETLGDLFDGRSQLIVYHFMFAPGWTEGCDGCSFLADHIDGANMHLAHHDVSLVAVSRAPLGKLIAFKQRMGWRFKWVSSYGSDFNYDFHVTADEAVTPVEYNYRAKAELLEKGEPWFTEGENHDLSVFYKDAGRHIFHTIQPMRAEPICWLAPTTTSTSPQIAQRDQHYGLGTASRQVRRLSCRGSLLRLARGPPVTLVCAATPHEQGRTI